MLATNLIIASPPIRAGIEPQVDTISSASLSFQSTSTAGMDVESNASVSQTIVQNSQRKPHSSGRILAVDGVNAANY